jgi:hypothetical protein
VTRKLEVHSSLSGIEAQVGKCINCKAGMERACTENEPNQRRNQANKNVKPLRSGVFKTKRELNKHVKSEISETHDRSSAKR